MDLQVIPDEKILIETFMGNGFHLTKDWNGLMPVVEKIGNVWDLNEIGTRAEKVLKLPVSSHIQEVYNEVIRFIKWYNQQKKMKTAERIRCNCACHTNKDFKHVMPCCNSGWIDVFPSQW